MHTPVPAVPIDGPPTRIGLAMATYLPRHIDAVMSICYPANRPHHHPHHRPMTTYGVLRNHGDLILAFTACDGVQLPSVAATC
jgi:hypothetical protein